MSVCVCACVCGCVLVLVSVWVCLPAPAPSLTPIEHRHSQLMPEQNLCAGTAAQRRQHQHQHQQQLEPPKHPRTPRRQRARAVRSACTSMQHIMLSTGRQAKDVPHNVSAMHVRVCVRVYVRASVYMCMCFLVADIGAEWRTAGCVSAQHSGEHSARSIATVDDIPHITRPKLRRRVDRVPHQSVDKQP